MGVEEIAKAPGIACVHLAGAGCGIYATRPAMCRAFACYYLTNPELDARWKPDAAHFCLVLEPGRLVAYVDEAHPDAWTHEPYASQLRTWALRNLSRGWQVVVAIGARRVAMLPDGPFDLGIVARGATITIERGPDGWLAKAE
jgi:hypothetical protein